MKRLICLVVLATFATLGRAVPDRKPTGENGPPKNFTNNIGMRFVWIKPGSFVMGSPREEEGRGDNEIQHKVTLTKGFYMGVHLVTQEHWQAVTGDYLSEVTDEKNIPVGDVSWDDCQNFIQKLRDRDKNSYRLPSEAKWEFACRAGSKTPFYFGETISTDQANYNGDRTYGKGKKGVHRGKPMPVGSFPANAWGLHDMHGNLFQWCQDWYGEYPHIDVVDPQGPNDGKERVLRGGASNVNPETCRSANRFSWGPDRRGCSLGIRLCFFVE